MAIYNVMNYGAVGNGSTDDTTAFQSAINAAGTNARIYVPGGGNFLITNTLQIDDDRVHIIGDGIGASRILFNPTAHDKIAFKFSKTSSLLTGCSIRDLTIYTSSLTYRKTAIQIVDTSNFVVDNVEITGTVGSPATGFCDTDNSSGSSKGIHTKGRDGLRVHNVFVYADYPLYIDKNPNISGSPRPLEDIDQANFHNCIFRPNSNLRPCINIVDGVAFAQVSFTGQQAWVGGTYGIYWNSTTSDSSCAGLVLENVRYEQAAATTAYAVYLVTNYAGGLQQIQLRNVYVGEGASGFYFRKCQSVSLQNVYVVTDTLEQLNVDSGVNEIEALNCFWQVGGTVSVTDQTLLYEMPRYPNAMPLPNTFRYTNANNVKRDQRISSSLSGPSITLAVNDIVTLAANDDMVGLLVVVSSGNTVGMFAVGGSSNSVQEISDPSSYYSVTKDTNGAVNVYHDATDDSYKIQNKRSGTLTFRTHLIGSYQNIT